MIASRSVVILKRLFCHNGPMDQLPVTAVLDNLKTALRSNSAAVLVAPPGAGKSTGVPLSLLEEAWLSGRRILLLAPRRMAARATARRMATLLGQQVGQTIGYRVRLESRVGPDTRIEVITEGVLTRMLQSDPSLSAAGLVIFDEFHERSLEADLGLALCRDIQGVLNGNLRLLVMSATLDPAPVAALLGNAPLIRCHGRSFPVQTRYVPRPANQPVEPAVARVVRGAMAAGEGNLLVFLPGAAEIKRVARLLEAGSLPDGWHVAPLYGNLPRSAQDSAIAPPPTGQGKVILATDIAETSLTIDAISVVVDSGLRRAPRFDPASGMIRLVTQAVSRASADQRRGRAGRLGPGICYRLWSEAAQGALVAHNPPEIRDTDLAGLALELAAWGVVDPETLSWLDPPPSAAFSQARRLLTDLGALDEDHRISPHGRQMAAMPLHPRLAHMMLMARRHGWGSAACQLGAILSERDPLHCPGRQTQADLCLRLDAVKACRAGQAFDLHGCTVDKAAVRRIVTVAAVLRKRLGIRDADQSAPAIGRLLAWAYPDRIAQRRPGGSGRFLLSGGRGAFVDPREPLSACDYLVAAHLDGERREARIFMAAETDRATLLEQFAKQTRRREIVTWDPDRKAVAAVRSQVLGALTLTSVPLRHPAPEAVLAALISGIRGMGIDALAWTRALRSWQARVILLARMDAQGGPWPDISDAALTDSLEHWLAPHLSGISRLSDLGAKVLSNALRDLLTWRQQRQLAALAPPHITVPSGSRLPIDYSAPVPVLAARIQEMFGATTTPAIVGGRMPLMLHLLSPAGRPAQITRDLAGFWQNSYAAVKKDLQGRYPKHFWPDDPLRAAPTARAKPRRPP